VGLLIATGALSGSPIRHKGLSGNLSRELDHAMRPIGLSAVMRCKNEEEYVVASILSIYRIFDEIVVVLNNSTDQTRKLIEDLLYNHPKIRLLEYANECSPIGPDYCERVLAKPEASLAKYYNWCLDQTSFSHVCKWDGDMIATPVFEQVRALIKSSDVVMFDGYDVLGKDTTDFEARIFKYDPARARYVDWDLYEVLEHDYAKISIVREQCYLHMKLVKKDWINKEWSNPNLQATRSVPETGAHRASRSSLLAARIRRIAQGLWRQSVGRTFAR
jgi:glycosyltransferase involved in cell wall biosynthesis